MSPTDQALAALSGWPNAGPLYPGGAQVRMNTAVLILCAVAYVAVAVADYIERRR